jgi:hypothetical protein
MLYTYRLNDSSTSKAGLSLRRCLTSLASLPSFIAATMAADTGPTAPSTVALDKTNCSLLKFPTMTCIYFKGVSEPGASRFEGGVGCAVNLDSDRPPLLLLPPAECVLVRCKLNQV